VVRRIKMQYYKELEYFSDFGMLKLYLDTIVYWSSSSDRYSQEWVEKIQECETEILKRMLMGRGQMFECPDCGYKVMREEIDEYLKNRV
jgi:DNA-directed RNA polymerase subunit RPC12/RpoP